MPSRMSKNLPGGYNKTGHFPARTTEHRGALIKSLKQGTLPNCPQPFQKPCPTLQAIPETCLLWERWLHPVPFCPALSAYLSGHSTCSENLRSYCQEGICHHCLRVQRDVQLAGDIPVDVGANVFQLIPCKTNSQASACRTPSPALTM